jgi:hypothetical protein
MKNILYAPLRAFRASQRAIDKHWLFPSFRDRINEDHAGDTIPNRRNLMVECMRLHAEHDAAWLELGDANLRHELTTIAMKHFPPEG